MMCCAVLLEQNAAIDILDAENKSALDLASQKVRCCQ